MGTPETLWRLEISERGPGRAAKRLAERAFRVLGDDASGIAEISQTTLYLIDRPLHEAERTLLGSSIVDQALQDVRWVEVGSAAEVANGPFVEVALRAGVTDPLGEAVGVAANVLGLSPLRARSGVRYAFSPTPGAHVTDAQLRLVAEAVLHNDIVDDVAYNEPIEARFVDSAGDDHVEIVPIRGLDEAGLAALSVERGLALDPAELVAVQTYFASIDRDPTDAEIETIAQTWSEHCSHKTFRAGVTWDDGTVVEPLLKQLRRSTDEIDAPFVRSAFVDNAGIVAFDDAFDVAIKVETHNHPSAVEPFGGANTGVGGVIRDVMGVAADPIAVTNILCFGPLDMRADELPAGVLHPQRIRDGVVAGIADYGNKIGLPTVAGAVSHQEGFTANPLVFAGCIGLRPAGLVLAGQEPGDRIVVLGGGNGPRRHPRGDLFVSNDGCVDRRRGWSKCADRGPDRREVGRRSPHVGA